MSYARLGSWHLQFYHCAGSRTEAMNDSTSGVGSYLLTFLFIYSLGSTSVPLWTLSPLNGERNVTY